MSIVNCFAMIKLNLLSPNEKKYYQTEITRRFIVFFSIGLSIITTVFIGLLVFSYFFISFQIEPIISQLEIERATEKVIKIEEFEKQIKETNQKISLLLSVKGQATPITPLIIKLADASTEKDSYLKSFLLDRKNSIGKMQGFSISRNQVIKIQENLKNESLFSEINSPYSNFLKQSNIDFIFDFKIKQQ